MAILTDPDWLLLYARLGGDSVLDDAAKSMLKNDIGARANKAVKSFVGFDVEQATYTEYLPRIDRRSPESPLARAQAYVSPLGTGVLATDGVSELALTQRPVRSITSVHENRNAWLTDATNGDWSSGFLLTPGTDYNIDWEEPGLCSTGILTREGIWPSAKRTVRVIYVAGFTAGELATERWSAFKEAVMLTVQAKWIDLRLLMESEENGGIGPMTSERLGDWSASWSTAAIEHLVGLKFELPPEAKAMLKEFVSMGKYFGV